MNAKRLLAWTIVVATFGGAAIVSVIGLTLIMIDQWQILLPLAGLIAAFFVVSWAFRTVFSNEDDLTTNQGEP